MASITNGIYATESYDVVHTDPDDGNDRSGFVYNTDAAIFIGAEEFADGVTHNKMFGSGELFDHLRLDYVDGSFHVFGNNGSHGFGEAIDTGTGALRLKFWLH